MGERDEGPELSPEEELWLDRMLKAPEPIEPSAALKRAVAEIPLRHPRPSVSPRELAFGARPVWALRYALLVALLSIAAGAWLGYQDDALAEIALEGAVPVEDEWEELSLLAFADEVEWEIEP